MIKFYKRNYQFKNKDLKEIDFKNLNLLKSYITECNKIIPGRVTGLSAKCQRKLSLSIKHARYLALLPYTDIH